MEKYQMKRTLEMYLDSSRSLQNMDDKFRSIGLNIWEGRKGQSERVADDFCTARDVMSDYITDMFILKDPKEKAEFDKLANDYIYGVRDDRDDVINKMIQLWENALNNNTF